MPQPPRKWKSYFWIILVLGIVVFSWIGLSIIYPETNTLRYLPDRVYRIIKILSGFEPLGPSVEPQELAWQMIVVKILVIILLFRVLMKIVLAVFHEQFTALRVSFKRQHTIVIGAGDNATLLLSDYRKRTGQGAVVVEIDENNKNIATLKAQGHLVIIGDAGEIDTLHSAGVSKAHNLICFTHNPSFNAKVNAIARKANQGNRDKHILNSYLHLNNPRLLHLIPNQNALIAVDHVETHFFNIDRMIARQFFHQLALDLGKTLQSPEKTFRFLVFGATPTAYELILQGLRVFHLLSEQRSECVIFCEEAEAQKAQFADRYPQAKFIANFYFSEFNHCYSDLLHRYVYREDNKMEVIAVVAMADDDSNLNVTYELLDQSSQSDFPIYCLNRGSSELPELLAQLSNQPRLHYFGRQQDFCRVELITGEKQDDLAKAIHCDYLRQVSEANGEPVESESEAYQRAWDNLPEDAKDANRAQADHILYKLILTGKLDAFRASGRVFFSEEECEQLAMTEHHRWMAHRYLNGWRFGEKRDDWRKFHPSLIAWDELSEAEKQKDRDTILRLPVILNDQKWIDW